MVLPEMFASGFSMNLSVTRQGAEREDETFLATLARDHGVFVIGGVVSPGSGEKGRNESVMFSPASTALARYTKIHPFRNGNGRHARLITDIFLYSRKHSLPQWPQIHLMAQGEDIRSRYILAIKEADHGDFSNLIRFIESCFGTI